LKISNFEILFLLIKITLFLSKIKLMSAKDAFFAHIEQGYATKGDFIIMGAAMLDGTTLTNAHVKIPLKTLNRHGLIAGATGTGKTKTLQVIAENLSDKGIPVLLMDLKGDLSGLALPGPVNAKIEERHSHIGLPFTSQGFPVEILSLSEQDGVKLRATVSEFGPILLSRILDLSETQEGIVSVIFKYCDDKKLPLLDLKDFKKVLQYSTETGKEEFAQNYGRINTSSTGTILRKVIELEQQGADLFFGEKSFDVEDLVRRDTNGKGYISILRLTDIQDRPKLFSTFMLSLLAEIYTTFPEEGDSDTPKLILFIDEAHLIFNEASKALLNQIENIVKLIRSKGVGLYFVTQNPTDVPEAVLAQLGLKVQHALRAFTAKDRKAIKLTAENYPTSTFYKTDEILTALGTGEALISALDEKGRPTPLAATLLRAPMSRMDILTDDELRTVVSLSKLNKKYNEVIDRESAYEILNAKIERAEEQLEREKNTPTQRTATTPRASTRQNPVIKVLTSATFIRGVLGVLKKVMR
jgi:DNA helicase HerA-like ATPase